MEVQIVLKVWQIHVCILNTALSNLEYTGWIENPVKTNQKDPLLCVYAHGAHMSVTFTIVVGSFYINLTDI